MCLFGVTWMLFILASAGPLWRDELSSLNLAQTASLAGLWDHLVNDSCPVLWPIVLRAWVSMGFTDDYQIRILGFVIGMGVLSAPYIIAHWMNPRTPILSVSLLAFSPTVLFTVSSLRAYGLGALTLLFTMGFAWRVVERDSPARLSFLLAASILAAHSMYASVAFLVVILSSGTLALLLRRRWRSAAWIVGIGCISLGSMVIYRPIIRQAGETLGLFQIPFDVGLIAMAVTYSVSTGGPFQLWAWGSLIFLGAMAAMGSWVRKQSLRPGEREGGMMLFSLLVMLASPVAYGALLLHLRVPTQFWYYGALMAVVAVAIDGVLGGHWRSPLLRGCRLILALLIAVTAIPSVWKEVQSRRTNMDIVAGELMLKAGPRDLIIVVPLYYGTAFERYYTGRTPWMTLPPVESAKWGLFEAVKKAMLKDDPLGELLLRSGDTLRSGNRVWIVGGIILVEPEKVPPAPPPPPSGPLGWNHTPYTIYWCMRLSMFLKSHAGGIHKVSVDPGIPVNPFENVSLIMFSPPPGQRE